MERLAFDGDNAEIMEWIMKNSRSGFGTGAIMYVSPKNDYWGYPTGMGGRVSILSEELRRKSEGLVECLRQVVLPRDIRESRWYLLILPP